MPSFERRTIAQTHELLVNKAISPLELVQDYLERIEKLNPLVKAWDAVEKERALIRAGELEKEWGQTGVISPLFAIPYGAKDIIFTKGIATEGNSKTMAGHIPDYDATVIKSLHRAGAVLLGKTTTTEFAHLGSPPETRNPWNLAHTPGGSSTGSAAALAADMAMMTLGTQTAGSLCRPAAYNGLTALKGTYGRISKAGVIPGSWSLDHVGAFTRTVGDAVLVFNELSGPDPDDPATKHVPKTFLEVRENREYTIGVISDPYFEAEEEAVATIYSQAVRQLEKIGYKVKRVKVPGQLMAANAAQHTVMQAEAATYHAEHYEKNSFQFGTYLQDYLKEGLKITAKDYIEAQRTRREFRSEFLEIFKEADVVLTPTTPTTAPRGIDSTGLPTFNLPFTNIGVPTLTVPIGFSADNQLPVGMQIISGLLEEQKVIDVGHLFQMETDWHLKQPLLNENKS